MTEKEPREKPDKDLVFKGESVDGWLTMIIKQEDEVETELMKEFGGMGVLQISGTESNQLYHEERIALSPSAIFGPGPTDEEVERWANIMSLFADE